MFTITVTELEVEEGIFRSASDPNDKCLCFVRIIEDIDDHLTHPKAWRFIDMMSDDVDNDSQKQLTTLRDDKLKEKLIQDNVFR